MHSTCYWGKTRNPTSGYRANQINWLAFAKTVQYARSMSTVKCVVYFS